MNSTIKSLLALAFLVAVCAQAAGQTKSSPKPSGAPIPKNEIASLKTPMIFYLAKGEPGSCGPGCSDWIAAEGTIDDSAAERMRGFLKRQPGSKRPIYFNSPGGYAQEALAIGRLMRERGMTAGVARTLPKSCETEKECASLKRSGQEVSARLMNHRAQCNSACVYAIAGARVREIGPEVSLGVHASKTVIVGKLPEDVKLRPEDAAASKAETRQRIKRYLVEMGVQPALLDAAEKIPNESIRFLTRDEIVRFGIDTRTFVESDWFYEGASGPSILKLISSIDREGASYRTTTISLTCSGRYNLSVFYMRELSPKDENLIPLKVISGDEVFALPAGQKPVVNIDPKRYDIRRAWVPQSFFESAVAKERVELAELAKDSANDKPERILKLSTKGLSAVLPSLIQRCVTPQG